MICGFTLAIFGLYKVQQKAKAEVQRQLEENEQLLDPTDPTKIKEALDHDFSMQGALGSQAHQTEQDFQDNHSQANHHEVIYEQK